ncbi:MAG: hypothetical protein RLZZ60_1813 [Bacteroidota bacterium]|jgi:uncharacterized membrane protein
MSLFNKPFFSPQEAEAIQQSIVEAERLSSGEIRVHIDRNCKGNVLDKAQAVFTKLGMQSTQLRNGVLIYLVPKQKLMAIIGDVGIHEKVGQDFWDNIYLQMKTDFAKEQYCEGLQTAVLSVGKALQTHFPIQDNDQNELSNTISYGD